MKALLDECYVLPAEGYTRMHITKAGRKMVGCTCFHAPEQHSDLNGGHCHMYGCGCDWDGSVDFAAKKEQPCHDCGRPTSRLFGEGDTEMFRCQECEDESAR